MTSTKPKEIESTDQFYDSPISIGDACSMLRRKIPKNERPYTQAVLQMNNKKVDEWKDKLLRKLAGTTGTVPASKVFPAWQIYEEGLDITKMIQNKEHMQFPDEKVVMYWKDIFENCDIDKLYDYGTGIIGFNYMTVMNYIRVWCAQEKWNRVFSKSDDPEDWYRDAQSHRKLFNGEELPFWDKEKMAEICQKISTILSLRVEPSKT